MEFIVLFLIGCLVFAVVVTGGLIMAALTVAVNVLVYICKNYLEIASLIWKAHVMVADSLLSFTRDFAVKTSPWEATSDNEIRTKVERGRVISLAVCFGLPPIIMLLALGYFGYDAIRPLEWLAIYLITTPSSLMVAIAHSKRYSKKPIQHVNWPNFLRVIYSMRMDAKLEQNFREATRELSREISVSNNQPKKLITNNQQRLVQIEVRK